MDHKTLDAKVSITFNLRRTISPQQHYDLMQLEDWIISAVDDGDYTIEKIDILEQELTNS